VNWHDAHSRIEQGSHHGRRPAPARPGSAPGPPAPESAPVIACSCAQEERRRGRTHSARAGFSGSTPSSHYIITSLTNGRAIACARFLPLRCHLLRPDGCFLLHPEPCQCNVTGHGVPEDPAPDSTSSTPCRARRRPTARRPCGRGADPRDYSRSRPWPLHARMARPPNRRPPSAGQNTALARPELSSMRTRCTAPPTSMQRKEGRR
jgi:hypothetical protein